VAENTGFVENKIWNLNRKNETIGLYFDFISKTNKNYSISL
jgi:hypothetical protein